MFVKVALSCFISSFMLHIILIKRVILSFIKHLLLLHTYIYVYYVHFNFSQIKFKDEQIVTYHFY